LGYWENTTYLRHASAPGVARRLASLFADEQMEPVDAPPPRAHRGLEEAMQYDDALHNDLWGVAVIPGAPGWTIVKTAPLELLAERRSGADRMRLAEACAALAASAVQVNVYDGTSIVLVEASPDGGVLLSGWPESGSETWHSERLAEETFLPRFRVHPALADLAGDGLGAERIANGLAARLGGENAEHCDNLVSVSTLVTHQPLEARGGSLCTSPPRYPRRNTFPSAASARSSSPGGTTVKQSRTNVP
jgi:hypothetical protein